jgi:DNA-directed RNA polymerase subunit RPC12/RpoP
VKVVIGVDCPNCGAPTPLALNVDKVDCNYCDYIGELSPEDRQRIEAAKVVLHQSQAHQRQLTAQQRRALARVSTIRDGGVILVSFVGIKALLFVAPFVLLMVLALVIGFSLDSIYLFCMTALPISLLFLLVLVPSGAWFRRLNSQLKEVEFACAAIPPGRKGYPAKCYVCGGNLVSEGVQLVVRCSYCEADNLVAPKMLQTVGAVRKWDLDTHHGQISTKISRLGQWSIFGIILFPIWTVAMVVMVGILWITVGISVGDIEDDLPTERGKQVAWVSTPKGTCLVSVEFLRSKSKEKLFWMSEDESLMVKKRSPWKTIQPKSLVRQNVYLVNGSREELSTILRVHGTLIFNKINVEVRPSRRKSSPSYNVEQYGIYKKEGFVKNDSEEENDNTKKKNTKSKKTSRKKSKSR